MTTKKGYAGDCEAGMDKSQVGRMEAAVGRRRNRRDRKGKNLAGFYLERGTGFFPRAKAQKTQDRLPRQCCKCYRFAIS